PLRVPFAARNQIIDRGGARLIDSRLNTATTRSNLLVTDATCSFLKLIGASTGENRVRMCIDKTGQNNSTASIDNLDVRIARRLYFAPVADSIDAASTDEYRTVVNDGEFAQFGASSRSGWSSQCDQLLAICD